jgi:DedD protein
LKSQPPCYDDAHDDTHFNTEEPVSPERGDPIDDQDSELYEDVAPRSIFAATWFRIVLVVIVLGVVGAVAVPYVLDWMNPPPMPRTAATAIPSTPLTPPMPAAAETPASERPPADSPPSENAVAEKRDSSMATAMAKPSAISSSATPVAAESRPGARAVPEAKAEPQRSGTSGGAKGNSAAAAGQKVARPSAAKPTSAAKPESAAKTAPRRVVAKATTPTAVGGSYWVQVGAFRDAESARRLAAKLREENFKVEESLRRIGGGGPSTTGAPAVKGTPPAGTADQYDVLVSGMSVEELNRRLGGKGLAAEGSGAAGLVVKPSLPLRDAVALSKDLAVDGFKVQVRRASAAASAPAIVSSPSPEAGQGAQSLHRVRVGAFADRTAAVAAARELEGKGLKPYIARGDQ